MIDSGIYLIICVITNKFYVGRAFNFKTRWTKHKSDLNKNKHPNEYLQYAWNKHGENNFQFHAIEHCDKEKLIEREQHWLDKMKACNRDFGYNLNPSAENSAGFKHTDETKEKLRQSTLSLGLKPPSALGRKMSEETKAKIAKANSKPKKNTDKMKGKIRSDEHRNNLSTARANFRHTEETKSKISNSLKGNQYALGYRHTDEAKSKISEGNKKYHASN